MTDELKIVVGAEIELDKKQAEQEIESAVKKIDIEKIKIQAELDKEDTRKKLNDSISSLQNMQTVKLKGVIDSIVVNDKAIRNAQAVIRKKFAGLSVPINIDADGKGSAFKNGLSGAKSIAQRISETIPKMETRKQKYTALYSKLGTAGLQDQQKSLKRSYQDLVKNFEAASANGATAAQWDTYALSVKKYTEAVNQANIAIATFNEKNTALKSTADALSKFDTQTAKFESLTGKLRNAGLSEEAERISSAYRTMQDALSSATQSASALDWSAYTQSAKEFESAMQQSRIALSDYNEEQRKQALNAKNAQKAENTLLSLQKMKIQYSKAFRNINNVNKASEIESLLNLGGSENIEKGVAAFKRLKLEIEASGKASKTLTDKLKEMAQQFAQWFSISNVITKVVQGMKQVVGEVKEIDASMEELEKVTTSTGVEYERFLGSAKKTAKELSTTVTAVIDSTTGWSRLGYGMKESAELGKWSTIYENVGDNIESTEAATKHLVSITKAFGTEGKSMVGMVESVVDRLNAVGNRTSISSGEIGTALQNSAASLSAAGNTLSESIALTVGAYDITQDASETGNMWKTVSCDLFLIEKIRRYMLWRTNGLTSGMIG